MEEEQIKAMKKSVRDMMSRDRQLLLMRFPFTGAVAMRLDLIPVHDCRLGTCSTDYENIYADVEFYSKLTSAERLHILAHEVWHCVMMHGLRQQNRDPSKFNIAADLELYFLLCREGLGIKAHLPYLEEWENGWSAEQIYEDLDRLKKRKQEGGYYIEGESVEHLRFGKEGQGFDKHEQERKGADGHAVLEGPGDGDLYFDKDYRPGWARIGTEGLRGKILSAAQQMERTRGKLPAHIQGLVETLLKPEIRWQELLAQFVTSVYGSSRRWLPPNRRYVSQGLYLQSSRTEKLRAVVAIDTSGSTERDLPKFFAELNSLLQSFGNYELIVIQCDAEINHVETFDESNPPPSEGWSTFGGGGTDFRPVFDYVAERVLDPSLLIFFTDGYGLAPELPPKYPVMWLLTRDGVEPSSWGRPVKFKKEG